MSLTTHDNDLEGLDAIEGVDALCLFISEDVRPLQDISGFVDWRLAGGLSRVLLKQFFTGAPDENLLFPSEGRLPMSRIFAVGLGRAKTLDAKALGEAMAGAARMLSRAKVNAVALEVPGAAALSAEQRAEAFTEHFLPAFEGSRVAVLAERALRSLLPAGKY